MDQTTGNGTATLRAPMVDPESVTKRIAGELGIARNRVRRYLRRPGRGDADKVGCMDSRSGAATSEAACSSPPTRHAAVGHVFGDEMIAAPVLDRVLHHTHVLVIQGDSFRRRQKKRAGHRESNH